MSPFLDGLSANNESMPIAAVASTPAKHGQERALHLVWCFERCHKEGKQAVRDDMRESMAKLGGAMVCLKKARQFDHWIERNPKANYILLTDWREAKPCADALNDRLGKCGAPMMTIVICDIVRQVSRAVQWAQSMGSEGGSVWVVVRGSIPTSLLDGLIFRCFNDPADAEPSNEGPPPPRAAVPAAAAAVAAWLPGMRRIPNLSIGKLGCIGAIGATTISPPPGLSLLSEDRGDGWDSNSDSGVSSGQLFPQAGSVGAASTSADDLPTVGRLWRCGAAAPKEERTSPMPLPTLAYDRQSQVTVIRMSF
mmetsp:Transcript_1666/g.6555  ORF Transcript_1666/g.6555 Transcript_1666/m.6555 type:complete len:309 (+) Transcript_1666:83-1009(+)|eukprot:CAMPEP_0203905652 /NCGR_PEP_ID=MMETSP0359-20131031/47357_1 /ASSEMBLY_ACC=CAM_ASM_000338 /TAXON_ID=268821 /ORGANISM="Scrippsiella Hangoei, Strain SHTV-5" /LENGTH=308 /DNA_ID=CAMNT_0050830157 /DNA_START=28 /DNA_END=954 /DNA_ORIENTATION=-